MAELEGNVLRPPGFGPTVTFDPVEELLASTGHGYIQKGGTVIAGTGQLKVGDIVKKGGTGNKFWVKATGVSDAAALGFVRNAVDATSEAKLINVVLSGAINCNVQALNGAALNMTTLAATLGGKYVPGLEYIIF